jgi:cytochrome c peroxidase
LAIRIEIEVTWECRTSFWIFAVALIAAMLSGGASSAQETTLSPEALRELGQVEAEIDRIEAQTLERLAAPPDNQVQQIELLGKSML